VASRGIRIHVLAIIRILDRARRRITGVRIIVDDSAVIVLLVTRYIVVGVKFGRRIGTVLSERHSVGKGLMRATVAKCGEMWGTKGLKGKVYVALERDPQTHT